MTSHLSALNLRLSNERSRLASAKTQAERDLRAVWIAQTEKEIGAEQAFAEVEMTDDELLRELTA